MANMRHEVEIDAPAEKVYEAITTQSGLRGWWTADSAAEPRVGSVAVFGFYNRRFLLRMHIEELTPGKKVVWTCLGEDDEWKDTRLIWQIFQKEGATVLRFIHGDWRSTSGYFAYCNSTWGMLVYRLKDYAEGKTPGPYY